jgi:DNA end-binding protein Ku
MLHYADEVRELTESADWKRVTPTAGEVDLARQFVEALSKDFDPAKYHDEYRERLMQIIRAKAEGQPVVMPEAPATPAKVIDLMEALRQSAEQARKPAAKAAPSIRVAAEHQAKTAGSPQKKRAGRTG